MFKRVLLSLTIICLCGMTAATAANVPTIMNYQGVLKASGGTPVTTPVNVTFSVYDAEAGGTALWSEDLSVTPDAAGVFNVMLGQTPGHEMTDAVFNGADRWVGIKVGTDTEMAPRMRMGTVPFTNRIATVDGATAGEMAGELVLRTDGSALRVVDAMDNEHIAARVDGPEGAMLSIRGQGGGYTQHAGGASAFYSSTKADAKKMEIGEAGAVVFGASESDTLAKLNADGSMALTGRFDLAWAPATKDKAAGSDNFSVGNNVDLSGATNGFAVGQNLVGANVSVFLLGDQDTVTGANSIVLGYGNRADAPQSAVIGTENYAAGDEDFVLGTQDSIIQGYNSSILGGNRNVIRDAANVTIGGGLDNEIKGSSFSVMGGGERNKISSAYNGDVVFNHGFIGCGSDNIVGDNFAVVAGGTNNQATENAAFIGGGGSNTASGNLSVVTGGDHNTASGAFASVPGGELNVSGGSHSLAAGLRAKANNNGSFVWSDETGSDFATSADNQFLIRASGGVGIGLNNPSTALEVAGTVDADAFTINGTPVGTSTSSYWNQSGSNIYYNSGNVGVGTTSPSEKMEVSGNLKVTGTITSGTSTVTIDGPNNTLSVGNATNGTTVSAPVPGAVFNILSATRGGQEIFSAAGDDAGAAITISSESTPGDEISFGPPGAVFNILSATRGGQEILSAAGDDEGAVITMSSESTPGDQVSFGPPGAVFRLKKDGNETMFAGLDGTGAPLMSMTSDGATETLSMTPDALSFGTEWTTADYTGAGVSISDAAQTHTMTMDNSSISIIIPEGAMEIGDVGAPVPGAVFRDASGTARIELGGVDAPVPGAVFRDADGMARIELGGVDAPVPGAVFRDASGTARIELGGVSAPVPGAVFRDASGTATMALTSDGSMNMMDDVGNTRMSLDATSSGGRIAFMGIPAPQKDGSLAADTNFQITPDGNIEGKGTIVMGESSSGAVWATCFGYSNTASGDSATVSGGYDNNAAGVLSVVGGGALDTAGADGSVISGGYRNIVAENNNFSVIGGGLQNRLSSGAVPLDGIGGTIGGGIYNSASGQCATIPGGRNNAATYYGFAAGANARSRHLGSFVLSAENFASDADSIASGCDEQFVIRAEGGIQFTDATGTAACEAGKFINTSTGAYLSDVGVWTDNSDRNLKENLIPVDEDEILAKISTLPISSWNFKRDADEAIHIGPMAQDFYALFGIGEDDKHIASIDANGIALAAIQALHQQNQDQQKQITELKALVERLLAERQ